MTIESETKPTKRQQLGERSRDEILNAALRSMSVYGYEGTSIARIASESGLPSSSIYWHFSSKAGVLTAVMERGAERFFSDSSRYINRERGEVSPRELLREVLRNSAKVADAHPEFLRLLLLLTLSAGHDEQVMAIVRSVTERGMAALHDLVAYAFLEHGQARASAVADRLVVFAQGAFDGAFLASQTHDHVSHTGLMDTLTDALLALGDAMLASPEV